jgi:hypothetical protein
VPVPINHPALLALDAELRALAKEQGAKNAAVLDSSGNLWCHAAELDPTDMPIIEEMLGELLDSAEVPLASGGKARVVRDAEEPFAYAISYLSIYVLLVWFEGAFDGQKAMLELDLRLPRITRLTEDLPPDDGPYRPAESARGRPGR